VRTSTENTFAESSRGCYSTMCVRPLIPFVASRIGLFSVLTFTVKSRRRSTGIFVSFPSYQQTMTRAVLAASLLLERKLAGPYTLPLLPSAIFCSLSSVSSGKFCLLIVAMCCRYSMHRAILPSLASHRGDSVNKLLEQAKAFQVAPAGSIVLCD